DDLETRIDDVPTHHSFSLGIEDGARRDDAWPAGRAVAAAHQDGRCAVAEEAAGDDVRDGEILALQRQRAQLDGEQCRNLPRKGAYRVRRSRKSGRAGDATEAEERDTLQVRAKCHPVHQTRIDGTRREPGNGHEVEMIEVARTQVG